MARATAVLLAVLIVVLAVVAPAPAAPRPAERAAGATRDALVYQGQHPDDPERNAIFLADADGGHRHQILAQVAGDLTHPDWSPDGRNLVVVVDSTTLVRSTALGAQTSTLVTCAAGCVGVDYPAWSPHGVQIAYTRYTEAGAAGPPAASVIVLRSLKTGAERIVARSAPGQLVDVPRWSGDGKRLVFGIDRFDADGIETGSAVAVVSLRDGETRMLTSFDEYAYAPDWNRRTGEIVYGRETLQFAAQPPPGPRDLFGIRPDGSGLRQISHLTGDRMRWQPAVQPDGRGLVATLDEPGGRRGVRVDLRTGKVERLAPGVVMTHLKQRPR